MDTVSCGMCQDPLCQLCFPDYKPSRVEFYEQEQARLDREKGLPVERRQEKLEQRANEEGQTEGYDEAMSTKDHKPSNPKDLIGAKKLPTSAVPSTALIHLTHAFLEGALKYGRYNWRVVGVRSSIYLDALERHLKKYTEGQDRDPNTRVHHLASVMACAAIILDAERCGKLTDDRPPSVPADDTLIDDMQKEIAHLQQLFAGESPYQYTIKDTPE